MQINVIQIMEFSQQSTKPVFLRSKYSKIPNKRTGCLLENEKKKKTLMRIYSILVGLFSCSH